MKTKTGIQVLKDGEIQFYDDPELLNECFDDGEYIDHNEYVTNGEFLFIVSSKGKMSSRYRMFIIDLNAKEMKKYPIKTKEKLKNLMRESITYFDGKIACELLQRNSPTEPHVQKIMVFDFDRRAIRKEILKRPRIED